MKKINGFAVALTLAATLTVSSFAVFSPAALAQSATNTPVSSVLVYVTTTTTVYTTPSTTGFTEGTLFAGQTWFAIGQNADGSWIQIQIPSNSGFQSWVPANTLALNGVTLPITNTSTAVPGSGTTSAATAVPSSTPAATSTVNPSASPAASATSVPPTVNPQAMIGVPFLITISTTTNIYDMPSTSGDVEGQVTAGQTWFVLGVDATGKWVQIQIPSNNGLPGWIAASSVPIAGLNIPLSPLVTPITPSAANATSAATIPAFTVTITPTS